MEHQADGGWRKPFALESERTDKLLASHLERVLIRPASTLLTNYVSQFQDDLSAGLCSIEWEARALLLIQTEVIATYSTVTFRQLHGRTVDIKTSWNRKYRCTFYRVGQKPLCTCARKVLHFWKWESPIYKTFWVTYMTCVTLHVDVISSNYSNRSTINLLWLSPLHLTSDGCAGTSDFLCTFYTRITNTDLYSAVSHTLSTNSWRVL